MQQEKDLGKSTHCDFIPTNEVLEQAKLNLR